ncbi:MAG: ABC transporter permease [Microthrixaceae bacterium]
MSETTMGPTDASTAARPPSRRSGARGRIWAVTLQDLRLMRADYSFLVIMVLMPLVVMGFLKGAFAPAMVQLGVPDANGAEQAVPGAAVVFSFFLVGNVGYVIFREHGWHTWVRLRASPASTSEILAGKMFAPVLSSVLQLGTLFGVGIPLYGLRVTGSLPALIPVSLALAVCLTMLGLALASLCRTIMQLNSIVNVGTLLLGGLGGALTPVESLPAWAQTIAPGVPSYWAMRGYRSVILDGGGLSEVWLPVAVLLGFALAFAAMARVLFKVDDTKVFMA